MHLLEELVLKVIYETDGLTCGFHLGAEFLAHLGELLVAEHGNLDGVALAGGVEVEVLHLLLAHHHLGGIVDIRLVIRLGDERHGASGCNNRPLLTYARHTT